MVPLFTERPAWFKSRGYLHITPKINIFKRYKEIYMLVNDENFVAKHGFFPLIHSVIKERKFKKLPDGLGRGHSYKKGNVPHKTAKIRPLHYATHIDSMIYGCYAEKLLKLYEAELNLYPGLTESVIAYRKIEVEDQHTGTPSGKSTIHFAHEAFEEIKSRAANGCVVLMFDIKSFFSELNHDKLKRAWCDLLKVTRLNKAHFNVFNATTNFKYILKDELRISPKKNGQRTGFDEKKLAFLRKYEGVEAFFLSVDDFKDAIKNKEIKVYKHPFMKNKKPVGIPQGLPISAVLANLYLLEFDKEIVSKIVNAKGSFYRRYSDDIMIICEEEEADDVECFVLDEIAKSEIEISVDKTEKYSFKKQQISPNINRITSTLISNGKNIVGKPLTYLGFEFYGYKTLIKSSNLAKYYRRMISSVKRKAARACKISQSFNDVPVIFPRQLRKIYDNVNLNKKEVLFKRKILVKNEQGFYYFKHKVTKMKSGSNYLSYVNRASFKMSQPDIKKQVRNRKSIYFSSLVFHLKNKGNF